MRGVPALLGRDMEPEGLAKAEPSLADTGDLVPTFKGPLSTTGFDWRAARRARARSTGSNICFGPVRPFVAILRGERERKRERERVRAPERDGREDREEQMGEAVGDGEGDWKRALRRSERGGQSRRRDEGKRM